MKITRTFFRAYKYPTRWHEELFISAARVNPARPLRLAWVDEEYKALHSLRLILGHLIEGGCVEGTLCS